VASAGEVVVKDGRLQYVTAASGHYQPGYGEMGQLANELSRNGVNNVPIYDFTGRTRWF
jgi:hypothetical protein